MQLNHHPKLHLTYCTNVHPGEHWEETFRQLQLHLPELKKRLSPEQPFGIGLRLSALAAKELLEPGRLHTFKQWLDAEELYVFTINGFPYGRFHGKAVKDNVYKPDWSTKERLSYTGDLVDILAGLLPEGMDGSISTSPVSYKYWGHTGPQQKQILRQSCIHFASLARKMAEINNSGGPEIHLAIEPEPDCLLENSRETEDFFTNHLFPEGSRYLSETNEISEEEARQIIEKHIGVCYDTCHFALEYEDPAEAVRSFREAGIRISKTQISAALKVNLDLSGENRKTVAGQLQQFVEPVYLHQVIERRADGSLLQYRDLPLALENLHTTQAAEWRIHFHVPVFHREFNGLYSTRDEIVQSLQYLAHPEVCTHFEIETYTWDVLPDHLKADITDSIEREYRWTMDYFSQQ